MRISATLLDRLVGALGRVLRFDRAADRVLSEFFRAHEALGRADRAFVAETVYACLRRLRLMQLAAATDEPRRLALATLVRLRGVNLRELDPAVTRAEAKWLGEVKAAARGALPFEVECDLPDWVVGRLRPVMGDDALRALAGALNQPAPLDLRVNILKVERDVVRAALAQEGIAAEPTPYSPWGLRLLDKPALNKHPLFLDGSIEVQDEGSQLLCLALAPRRGEMVVDFCAGAGGKSLALGAMMRSTGRVYAFDISEKRLLRLKPRLARSGLSNVHPQRIAGETDARVKRLSGKIDRVLVDAPCSGLGTLRRNPDLKWRQSEADLAELVLKQASILAAAAALVKPGGRLVYATCSILPDENEVIVNAFLAAHSQFRLAHARDVLAESRVVLPVTDEAFLRLRPDMDGTDGFFAAVLERSS